MVATPNCKKRGAIQITKIWGGVRNNLVVFYLVNWADVTRKSLTTSVQFQQTLLTNSALAPHVKANKSFWYLGRYFYSRMLKEVCKKN